ncbi:MAG: hypothetical protein ABL927_00195 [Bdellovibrionales bacterium]
MWSTRQSKYMQPSAYSRRSTRFIDRNFQLKYTYYILGVAIASTLLFILPALYFTNQNYQIFYKLADLSNPDLASYISREQFGLNVLFACAAIANIIFWYIFSLKMTAKIAGPAKILRNHIRLMSRGDFSLPMVRLRDDDEFVDLINTYNYFYTLLKTQNKNDLNSLLNIRSSVSNSPAREVIQEMIRQRTLRLGLTPDHVEVPVSSHDSRHAS